MTTDAQFVLVRLGGVAEIASAISSAALDWLSDSEQRRLELITSRQRASQFLAGHWLVRRLAAEEFGGEPSDWLLDADPGGAPRLRSSSHDVGDTIAVSISHSANWVAAAIAPFAVGVDFEGNSKSRDVLALAEATLSTDEVEFLRGLPERERAAAFYLRWTLKEAAGKRAGHGLRPELARRQRPIACLAHEAEAISWQFDGGSLAVAGRAGMSVRVAGLPAGARQDYWRIEVAGS